MEKLIILWQNMTTEQLVITLLIASNIGLWIRVSFLSGKYHLLNANFARACDEIYRLGGMKLIRQHHSGEYTAVNPLLDKE